MAIEFYAGEGFEVFNAGGSGIGFYGSSFGASVAVGSHPDKVYLTDSVGTAQGPEIDITKYASSSGVITGAGSGIHLLQLPNYQSLFEVRFTHDSPVSVTNTRLYVHTTGNTANAPSGVSAYVAEIIHPSTVADFSGSGDAAWYLISNPTNYIELVDSPGVSGLSPNGPSTTSDQHSWYVAMSVSPSTVGAKTFRGTVELEYL